MKKIRDAVLIVTAILAGCFMFDLAISGAQRIDTQNYIDRRYENDSWPYNVPLPMDVRTGKVVRR